MMRSFCVSGFILGLACVVLTAAPAPEEKDYQKIADKEAWAWDKEKASVVYSQKEYKGSYEVELLKPALEGGFVSTTVRLMDGTKEMFSFVGHDGTVFAGRKNILYYADFSPWSSGCSIVAYDLKEKKQLWKTDLKGLGPISHTKYRNAVILEAKDDVLHILGQESAGKYVEYVELKGGKTVGHKVFTEK